MAPAGMGIQVVPDQHDRAAELVMGDVQQPGVIGLYEPLAAGHVGIGYVIDSGFLTGDTEIIGRHRNERVWCRREPDAVVVTCGASR